MRQFSGKVKLIAQGHATVFVGERGPANLAKHVGEQGRVNTDRASFATQVGCQIQWLRQVHGVEVLNVDSNVDSDGQLFAIDPIADAAITSASGVAIAILTADCLPVMFADLQGQYVAGAHAGWRGLANGVLVNTVQSFLSQGVHARDIRAFFGPCIGPSMFEVGDEVRQVFMDLAQASERAKVSDSFISSQVGGKWLANLPQLANIQLNRFGIVVENESSSQSNDFCTYLNPKKYFSYRYFCHHPQGIDGRQATLIWKT
jgi:polyphenol oxidase